MKLLTFVFATCLLTDIALAEPPTAGSVGIESEIKALIWHSGYKKFGKDFRSAATFRACGKDELKKEILEKISGVDLEFYTDELVAAREKTDKYGQYLRSIGNEELVAIAVDIRQLSTFYEHGYWEALNSLFLKTNPGWCDFYVENVYELEKSNR